MCERGIYEWCHSKPNSCQAIILDDKKSFFDKLNDAMQRCNCGKWLRQVYWLFQRAVRKWCHLRPGGWWR
jgi:hypothetical protein